jgi:hypothetical protein
MVVKVAVEESLTELKKIDASIAEPPLNTGFPCCPSKTQFITAHVSMPKISFVGLCEGKSLGMQQSGDDQNPHSPQDHQSCSLFGSSNALGKAATVLSHK